MGWYYTMQPLVQPKHLLWLTVGYVQTQPGLSCILEANSRCYPLYTYSRYTYSSYLSWMLLQTQLLGYPLFNKCTCSGCFSWLSFISTIFQSHLEASWLSSVQNLMQPAAITSNYSIKNIQNNIRQIIMTYGSTPDDPE